MKVININNRVIKFEVGKHYRHYNGVFMKPLNVAMPTLVPGYFVIETIVNGKHPVSGIIYESDTDGWREIDYSEWAKELNRIHLKIRF